MRRHKSGEVSFRNVVTFNMVRVSLLFKVQRPRNQHQRTRHAAESHPHGWEAVRRTWIA